MRVLVTGGTGVISSGIVQACIDRNIEVYAINRGNNGYRCIPGVNNITADLNDVKATQCALGVMRFDVVIECLVYDVDALKKSLEIFKNRYKTYVFISSTAVFKNNKGISVIKEGNEFGDSNWRYTQDKIVCENYIRAHVDQYIIIRPGVTFSKYRIPFPIATRTPSYTFVDRLVNNKPIISYKNNQRVVMHVDEFADIVMNIILNGANVGDDFNIVSNDNVIYWNDVIETICELKEIEQYKVLYLPLEIYKAYFSTSYSETSCDKYEEILYDKYMDEMVDDSKIRPYRVCKKTIKEEIKRIVNESEMDFRINRLKLDSLWNKSCDEVILASYVCGMIETKNLEYVGAYIENELHLNDDFVKKIREYVNHILCGKQAVYLWGAGNIAAEIFRLVKDIEVIAVIDSNKAITQKEFKGHEYRVIHGIDECEQEAPIVISTTYINEVEEVLNNANKIKFIDYFDYRMLFAFKYIEKAELE